MRPLLLLTTVIATSALTGCADHIDPTTPIELRAPAFARNASSNPGTPTENISCDTKASTTARAKDINDKNSCSRPGSITIVKTTNAAAGTFTFTPSANLAAATFTLSPAASNSYTDSRSYTNLPVGVTYTVTEALQSAPWSLTSLVCTGATTSIITTTGQGGREASILLGSGENITCTFTNTSSATVTWNFAALVTAGYPYTVQFEALEQGRTGCTVWDYMAYSTRFGDQSSSWGFLNLCASTGRNTSWDRTPPPSDGKDYYVRLYVDNGSTVTPPSLTLSGNNGATCTAWTWVSVLGWTSYCSITTPRTTITGTLTPP